MSFYGSIYYQLVDAFHRMLVRNTGLEKVTFPEEENVPIGETEIIYRAPGRQGTVNLQTGNRWIAFTKEGYKKADEAGNDKVTGVIDSEKPYTIWHNAPDAENCVPFHGFQKLDNMYLIYIDEELGDETFADAAARIIPPSALVEGCRAVYVKTVEPEEGEEGKLDNMGSLVEDGELILPDEPTVHYLMYELDDEGEWHELDSKDYDIRILSPDDFFIATESATVDNAGHVITTRPVYYKMPKSDVQEEIDRLKERMDINEELDEEQQELIEKHELAIGEWSDYCGAIYDDTSREEDKWIPTISKAIGPIGLLIDGTEYTSAAYTEWYNNPTVSITKAIGSLQELVNSYKSVDGLGVSEIEDVSLVKILIALKDKIIGPLSSQVAIQGALLERHEKDITDTILPAIEDLQKDVVGIYEDIEDLGLIHEEDIKEVNKQHEDAMTAIHDPTTGILAVSKAYTDDLADGAVADNAAAIAAINDSNTGILINAKTYTDAEVQKLINNEIKQNADSIAEINNTETGILAVSKAYTDSLATGAVAGNSAAIEAINNADSGILKQAQNYTDAEIAEMAYTDAPTDGQYVYSVNETNGVITVEHKTLPTYTLTSGTTNGTVAFNGNDVVVKGLGSAAYADTSAFAPANTKSEAVAEAKTETENQIAALTAEDGAIQINAKAIEDLQDLLKDYGDLVAKVADLEQRIIALEPPPPEEPELDPEEGIDDPETT